MKSLIFSILRTPNKFYEVRFSISVFSALTLYHIKQIDMKILVSKLTALWLCLLCLGLNAQNADKKEITIKIMKEVDGKMTEVNKTFTDINDPELQQLLQDNQIDIDVDNEEITSGETQMKIKVKEKDGKQNKQVIIKKSRSGDDVFMMDSDQFDDSNMIWIEEDDTEQAPKAFFGVMAGMERSIEIIDGERRVENSNETESGMRINKIIEGSGAEEAGLLAEDIIISVDKVDIDSIDDLIDLMAEKSPGDKVKVKYLRAGKSMKTSVTLGEKPKSERRSYMGKRHFRDFGDMSELKEFMEEREGLRNFERRCDEDIDLFYFDSEDTENIELRIDELLNRVQNLNSRTDNSLRVMVMIKDIEDKDASALDRRSSDYDALDVNNLSFFPNPNSGTFELEFSLAEQGDTQIRILDLNGQELFTRTLSEFSGSYKELIDISEREKGVYLLEVMQNNKIMHKKIVVQ